MASWTKSSSRWSPPSASAFPKVVPGVPSELLKPRNAWADKAAYDKTAAELSARFARNFEKFDAPPEVRAAGPHATTKK